MSALGDKDVGGLDIAVDDVFCMSGVERVCNLDGERQNRFRVHRSRTDAMFQGHAVEKLHGDKRLALLVVNFMNGADVGMIQGRGRLGFPLEAAERLRVFGYIVGKKLESDKATEL